MQSYDELTSKLSNVITELHLQVGDQLPPERVLAPKLGVSRNTLRNLLHKLEAHRIVSVRKGSGTYLQSCLPDFVKEPFLDNILPNKPLADRIEASYLLLPTIAALSAERIGARIIDELQQCNVTLSRSLFSTSASLIFSDIQMYFRLLAQGTSNQFYVDVVELLGRYSGLMESLFNKLDRQTCEKIFASHVTILNALRERDGSRAASIVENYLLLIAELAEQKGEVQVTDLVFTALKGRVEEWGRK